MLDGRDDTAKTGTKPSEEEEQVRLVVGKVNGCRATCEGGREERVGLPRAFELL